MRLLSSVISNSTNDSKMHSKKVDAQKSSVFSVPFGRKQGKRNTEKDRNAAIQRAIPFLGIKLKKTTNIIHLIEHKIQENALLLLLTSAASTFRVSWTDYSLGPKQMQDLSVSFGTFKPSETMYTNNPDFSGEIMRASMLIDCTVHEVLHLLMARTTKAFTSIFSQLLGDVFLGGEVMINIDDNEENELLYPVRTIKRFVLDISSKSNFTSLVDFVFVDSICITEDDNGNEVGLLHLNSIELNEVPPNVRSSKCQRAVFLNGSGLSVRKCQQHAGMTEICLVVRSEMGWLKSKQIRKVLIKFVELLKGVKTCIDEAISLHGSYSWHKGFKSDLRLVNKFQKANSMQCTNTRSAAKIQNILGNTIFSCEHPEEHDSQSYDVGECLGVPPESDDFPSSKVSDAYVQKEGCLSLRSSDKSLEVSVEEASPPRKIDIELCSRESGDRKIGQMHETTDDNNLYQVKKNISQVDFSSKGIYTPRNSLGADEMSKRVETENYKKKYEEVVEEKMRLEAEMIKLKRLQGGDNGNLNSPIGSKPSTFDGSSNNLFLDEEEIHKMKIELEKQKLENAKLRKKYDVIKAQTNNESLDKYNWDGELESAESIFLNLARKVQENPSDMVLLNDFERFEGIVRKHPEYKQREIARVQEWLKKNEETNLKALELMRSIVPENISSLSKTELQEIYKDRPSLARRVYNNRASFGFFYLSKTDIERFHIVDLKNKYEPKNFDIVELRAYFICLPNSFQADSDRQKALWKDSIRKKLVDMVKKFESGTLPKNKKRDPSYSAKKKENTSFKNSSRTMNIKQNKKHEALMGVLNKQKRLVNSSIDKRNDESTKLTDKKPNMNNLLMESIRRRKDGITPATSFESSKRGTLKKNDDLLSAIRNINMAGNTLRGNQTSPKVQNIEGKADTKPLAQDRKKPSAVTPSPNLSLLGAIRRRKGNVRLETEEKSQDASGATTNHLILLDELRRKAHSKIENKCQGVVPKVNDNSYPEDSNSSSTCSEHKRPDEKENQPNMQLLEAIRLKARAKLHNTADSSGDEKPFKVPKNKSKNDVLVQRMLDQMKE